MTTGLIVPNAGHIYLDDKDITGYPVYKRARAGVGYLPQEASVFRKMSVEDNISSVLEMTNTTKEYQKERLEELIARINKTNNETKSGDSTLTALIAKRDCLKQRISIMRDFLNRSSEKVSRYTKTEIRILSTVSVADIQKEVDKLSKELRETDETIQGLNWTTELL